MVKPLPDAGPDRYIPQTDRTGEERERLPKISEFFGISIYVYWREHPPPHFHALYAGSEVLVNIDDLSILEGGVSPRAMGLIVEWATLHQSELRKAWEDAQAHQQPRKIEPLR